MWGLDLDVRAHREPPEVIVQHLWSCVNKINKMNNNLASTILTLQHESTSRVELTPHGNQLHSLVVH